MREQIHPFSHPEGDLLCKQFFRCVDKKANVFSSQTFNAYPIASLLSDAMKSSAWMTAFDQFYKARVDGEEGKTLEKVVEAGIQKAMRIVLDLHTRFTATVRLTASVFFLALRYLTGITTLAREVSSSSTLEAMTTRCTWDWTASSSSRGRD